MRTIDTVVVGAGQAGLTMSWHLQEAGRQHVILDRRASLGGGWQDRWDAFRLVSPNWTASFPGHPYDGSDPDGFMPRDEIAGRVAGYAAAIGAPVELETEVRRLQLSGGRFRLETTSGPLEARTVVVATGGFHLPHRPPIAARVPRAVFQLHSQEYRNASSLPEGAVLVVGSGQSGVQIAEELRAAGRRVFLSVGKAGRLPRRYRGSDTFRWLADVAERGDAFGTPLPTVDRLADPHLRLAGNPHCSGHDGGHDTNLRRFAAEGMTLLGRIEAVEGARLRLASDLAANLASADRFFDERFRGLFDAFIERAGIDAPPDDRVPFDHEPPVLTELDLEQAGIATIVWTTGYRLDYGWIELPIFDELGFPRQVGGVSEVPGLFFLGSLWLRNQASSTLFGVGIDARRLAAAMGPTAVA